MWMHPLELELVVAVVAAEMVAVVEAAGHMGWNKGMNRTLLLYLLLEAAEFGLASEKLWHLLEMKMILRKKEALEEVFEGSNNVLKISFSDDRG